MSNVNKTRNFGRDTNAVNISFMFVPLMVSEEMIFGFFFFSQISLSLRCIDSVRKPLCEPNCLCIFFYLLRIISGPRVKFVQ